MPQVIDDDLQVNGTLASDLGGTIRDTLFVSSFGRLGPLAVQGELVCAGPLSTERGLTVALPATFQSSVTVDAGNLTLSAGGLICGGEAHIAQQVVAQDELRLLGEAKLEGGATVTGDAAVSGKVSAAEAETGALTASGATSLQSLTCTTLGASGSATLQAVSCGPLTAARFLGALSPAPSISQIELDTLSGQGPVTSSTVTVTGTDAGGVIVIGGASTPSVNLGPTTAIGVAFGTAYPTTPSVVVTGNHNADTMILTVNVGPTGFIVVVTGGQSLPVSPASFGGIRFQYVVIGQPA